MPAAKDEDNAVTHARFERRGRPPFGHRRGVGKNASTGIHNASVRKLCCVLSANAVAFHALVPDSPPSTDSRLVASSFIGPRSTQICALSNAHAPERCTQ